jgi:hypothetical protein
MKKLSQDSAPGNGQADDRRLTMKERAKKARHEAYVAAKERRKNDPRMIEMKAKLKEVRREQNAKAKEQRKNDPAQIALKEKLKADRRAARKGVRDAQKAESGAAKKAHRVSKDAQLAEALLPIAVAESARELAHRLQAELASKQLEALRARALACEALDIN